MGALAGMLGGAAGSAGAAGATSAGAQAATSALMSQATKSTAMPQAGGGLNIFEMGGNAVNQGTNGLIGGDYKMQPLEGSSLDRFATGYNSGGLDTMAANAGGGNYLGAAGQLSRFGMQNANQQQEEFNRRQRGY